MKNGNMLMGLAVLISSCSVEQRIMENTAATQQLKTQNDSLIGQLKQFNADYEAAQQKLQGPKLDSLQKTSFENFYYGNIVKEELVEKQGEWVKIKVQEKIDVPNGKPVLKDRTGWYFYSTPDVVYQVADVQSPMAMMATNKSSKSSEQIEQKALPALASFNLPMATTKADMQDQKAVDQLLAQRALNFDGLRFDAKRFDYANFSLGSFRGTHFANCNLSNIIGKREQITNENDFFDTKIEGGTNKDWQFSFWKFMESNFSNAIIENAKFDNCLFQTQTAGAFTFNGTTFKNTTFTNTKDGYMKIGAQNKTVYESCRFTDVKVYGSVGFEIKFINCVVNNGLWQGVSFNNTQMPPSRITGGFFNKLTIFGGEYSKMIIEQHGLGKPEFPGLTITSAFFNNASIDAWFKEGFKINGSGNFSGVNFNRSIFENGQFGDNVQPVLFNLMNANFSNCEFRTNVKFIKCDLRGATFPADSSNIEFIDCKR